jgi:hypothetical protein
MLFSLAITKVVFAHIGNDHCRSVKGYAFPGAVARLVGIEVGVVSGVFNLESPGVSALGWRLRHEES